MDALAFIKRHRSALVIGGALGGIVMLATLGSKQERRKPKGLAGVGGFQNGHHGTPSTGQPPGPQAPQGQEGDPAGLITRRLTAPSWYSDVLTNRDDGDCGTYGDDWQHIAPRLCDDNGRWDPQPMRFMIPLVRHVGAMVVTADVQITDTEAIVARTQYRTKKSTSGRKRGELDVNEYELAGPSRETASCQRISRQFSVGGGGPYLHRLEFDCGFEQTPRQNYELYRATRDVTLSGGTGETREYFAKIRPNTPAYAGQNLYALQLVTDNGWISLRGEVAASLAPQRLDVVIAYEVST